MSASVPHCLYRNFVFLGELFESMAFWDEQSELSFYWRKHSGSILAFFMFSSRGERIFYTQFCYDDWNGGVLDIEPAS